MKDEEIKLESLAEQWVALLFEQIEANKKMLLPMVHEESQIEIKETE